MNLKEFLRHFVTGDETWVHWYTSRYETVEVVDYTRLMCSEEGQSCPIGQKGDDHHILEVTWRRTKESQGSTMPNHWDESTPNSRKKGSSGEEKSVFPP